MAMVSNDYTEAKIERHTRGGRKLEYHLTCMQQPKRARACGSGAKSSADRRPVDPPPVVKLVIYEWDGDRKTDITFSYEANFFLFATLEHSRPIAHGRVQPPAASVPVLTGMPVSGMAYLDRPDEAGYFIFPDLSVRHEGKYKLSFNLYEETKDKNNDEDLKHSQEPIKVVGGPSPDSSFDWRMEVKSKEFTVYSAKKFPGLAESTGLSRMVAEQGCRVRIRRDVRMRRRDSKAHVSHREYDENDNHYERASHSGSVHDGNRSRSNSGTPVDNGNPYARRMSGELAPMPQGGALNFGASQYQAPPAAQFTQPQLPAQPSYQPAPAYHQQEPSYHQPPPPPQHSPYLFDNRDQYPRSAYPSNPPREPGFASEMEYRRASQASYSAPSRAPPASFPTEEPSYRSSYHGYRPAPEPPLHSRDRLAPLKLIEPKLDVHTPERLPPLPSPIAPRNQDRSYPHYPVSAPALPPSEASHSGKRTFNESFPGSAARQNEPLYNRQRPDIIHASHALLDDKGAEDRDLDGDNFRMEYRRANGQVTGRAAPEYPEC
ncbi:velvet factor-domain-containing protein [Bisporella sp. PMI_857]|nr:velvet factor-domain-containing protein [Bisporella sp. PMI_857]